MRDGQLKLRRDTTGNGAGSSRTRVRATARLPILVPVSLFIMFVMLYMGFERWWVAPIVFFGILVSASGGFFMLPVRRNLSVAVWVGFLALFGVADDDGVIIATYLESIFEQTTFGSIEELRRAWCKAGMRAHPRLLMTTATTVIGLLPIFWARGRGSDVMQPMAIPSVGGMVVAALVGTFIAPCLFCAVEERKWKRAQRLAQNVAAA